MDPLWVAVLSLGQVVDDVPVRCLRLPIGLPCLAKRGLERTGSELKVPAKRIVTPPVVIYGDRRWKSQRLVKQ
jgi:hypothetical protein